MLNWDRKRLSKYNYVVFRCIDIKKRVANGILEGYPGVYAICDNIEGYHPMKEGKILCCPQDWEGIPFTTFTEGRRYIVERSSFKNLKYEHFLKCKPIYEIKDNPFQMITYEERFGDDTPEEVAEFFDLNEKEKEQLRIYQKAFGFSYRITEYEFTVITKRSGWRYNIVKKALYHEGHLAKNKTQTARGNYLQGWHRQKTGYLNDILDALSYITDHDYGFTSELKSSAPANLTVTGEKIYIP